MHVICHSATSVDGRIQGKRWPLPKDLDFFEGPAAEIKVDAWIVGRTTMQEFCSKKNPSLPRGGKRVPKTDFVGQHSAKTFAVAIDPMGKCRWDTNMVTTEHVIEVLTERVPNAYLAHLRERQVSYVFAGTHEIDLRVALRTLTKLFGIRRCRIDGGGGVNGSFLKAGLIDEISHVVVPVADGSTGTPTMFDAGPAATRPRGDRLELKSIKKLKQGVLWIRYAVVRRGKRG